MGQRGLPRRDITFMYLAWTLATLAVAGYGLAGAVWQLMLASFVFNALETAGTIVWATTKQRHVPAALLGRVSSLDWLISIGLLRSPSRSPGRSAARSARADDARRRRRAGRRRDLRRALLPGMRAVEGLRSPRMTGTYDREADVVCLATESAGTGVRALPRSWGGVEVDDSDRVLAAWYTRASERLPATYLAALPDTVAPTPAPASPGPAPSYAAPGAGV